MRCLQERDMDHSRQHGHIDFEGVPRNRCLVFSPDGEVSLRYDKVHLYPGLDEPNILSPGVSSPFDLRVPAGS